MKKNKIINIFSIIIIIVLVVCSATFISVYSKWNTPISTPKINYNFDMNNWSYDKKNNIYYQMGIYYCENSLNEENEVFEIYVPGEFLKGEKGNNEKYKCTINKNGVKSKYIAETAPIVLDIESKDCIEQKPHETYNFENVTKFTNEGYIYIWPCYRGIKENQEIKNDEEYGEAIIDGITDLKSVVRFYRYNKEVLPGNSDRIIAFGNNDGGTKSALLGVSGDSALYYSKLSSVGAIMDYSDETSISDGINATMCCSNINSLQILKKSYSWIIEQFLENNDFEAISDNAIKYASYINYLKLKSEDGSLLFLINSLNQERYTKGTYYDYILRELESYIEIFLNNTSFPYKSNKSNITYRNKKEYIDELNSRTKWIDYDVITNKINITNIKDFANYYSDKKENIKQIEMKNQYNLYYYLSDKYGKKEDLFVSRFWNISSLLDETCSSFLSEENLKLLLEKHEDVRSVNYNPIWAKDYTEKEKNEFIFNNFKSWVKSCY